MYKRFVSLVLFVLVISLVISAQGATIFLEDFEGPPAPPSSLSSIGWNIIDGSATYDSGSGLAGSVAKAPLMNTFVLKSVPGLVDDEIVLTADMFIVGVYDAAGGEGLVGIDDGNGSWTNTFLVGVQANPASPGYPTGAGGWGIWDGLNTFGRINITDGGSPGVGDLFKGGIGTVTLVVTFDRLNSTISVDILDLATQVPLNPTFVVPMTATGLSKLENCNSIAMTWNDIHPGDLREVDNISIVTSVKMEEYVPPTPNPMTWAQQPSTVDDDSITMTASTATDSSLPVKYYFECINAPTASSTWQENPTYVATGLDPVTEYTFRVKARDNAPSKNETGFSSLASATTELPTTSGLLLHLDASSLALSEGASVLTWASRAGPDARQTNPTLRPIYRANAFGDKPALDFDATDDYLVLSSTLANAGSVFAVVKFKSLASPFDENFIVSGNPGERLFWNNNQILVNNAAGFDFNDTNTDYIHTWIQGEKSYLNFTSQDSGIESGSMDGIILIGGEVTGSNLGPDALIAEIIVYDRALNANERRDIWRYLGNKYNHILFSNYIVDPVISSYAIQEHKPLPTATCQPGSTVSIMACRGEYEPGSFVVDTDKPLDNLMVTVGQLEGNNGIIASESVDVRVVKSCWLSITDYPGKMNHVLIHDPDLLEITYETPLDLAYEPYTQAMSFTRTPIDTATLQPANVNSRQQFWLTVKVPDDAKAGIYTGTISITADNAPTQQLTLELDVQDFDLLEPNFEYSLYNATPYYNDLLCLNEFKNMVAHGCMNPNIYDAGIVDVGGGTLDFTDFANHLLLREQAGMPKGSLYIVSGTPIHAGTGGGYSLAQVTAMVADIVTWAQARGYSDVYFMGNDEASGSGLTAQRPVWQAVHNGGGKIFGANIQGTFFPYVGDLFDCPVIAHPSGNPIDVSSHGYADPFLLSIPTLPAVLDPIDWILDPYTNNGFNPPDYPAVIQAVHDNGFKIFTYMDCLAGGYGGVPDVQRRLRGLGLYKANLDGTMTWSYAGYLYPPHLTAGPLNWWNYHSFILRGKEAPFDTISWEAYREGYDDARYLATLEDAMAKATAAGLRSVEVSSAQSWLNSLPTDVDLDSWREEMATRTESLLARPTGDFHWDLIVNLKDFALFAQFWQQDVGVDGADSRFDLYPDQKIDGKDLEIMIQNWLEIMPQ